MNFEEIKTYSTWKEIKKIEKGNSKDIKYFIQASNEKRYLLRISDISNYEKKKQEYERLNRYIKSGISISEPVDFGIFNNMQNVYMLLRWVEGKDMKEALAEADERKQYELGQKAGQVLKKMHQYNEMPVDERLEQRILKKKKQLDKYINSEIKIPGDSKVISFIHNNLDSLQAGKQTYLHGDYHLENIIYMPDNQIGIIDFERYAIGNPYEDFCKLESFGPQVSVPFCKGQINGYFEDEILDIFWQQFSVYAAHAALFSVVWRYNIEESEKNKLIQIAQRIFEDFDYFNSYIPTWFTK